MPIYEQTYKPWEAKSLLRWRWRTIAAQELRIALTSRLFKFLLLLACIPVLMFLLLFVSIDTVGSNPDSLAGMVLEETNIIRIDDLMFWRYQRLCVPFVVLFCLAVGSGSICNDMRNNLLEIYFAKPLTSVDYFFGKLAAVLFYPMVITVVPAWLFFLLHLLMTPDAATVFLREYGYLLITMPVYGLSLSLPTATLAMLCSALSRSTRFAAVSFCAILFMNRALSEFISEITHRPNLSFWSVGRSNEVLSYILLRREVPEDMYWPYGVYLIAAWCVVAAGLTFYRVRAVEVGS
jgi:hypothetical protein